MRVFVRWEFIADADDSPSTEFTRISTFDETPSFAFPKMRTPHCQAFSFPHTAGGRHARTREAGAAPLDEGSNCAILGHLLGVWNADGRAQSTISGKPAGKAIGCD